MKKISSTSESTWKNVVTKSRCTKVKRKMVPIGWNVVRTCFCKDFVHASLWVPWKGAAATQCSACPRSSVPPRSDAGTRWKSRPSLSRQTLELVLLWFRGWTIRWAARTTPPCWGRWPWSWPRCRGAVRRNEGWRETTESSPWRRLLWRESNSGLWKIFIIVNRDGHLNVCPTVELRAHTQSVGVGARQLRSWSQVRVDQSLFLQARDHLTSRVAPDSSAADRAGVRVVLGHGGQQQRNVVAFGSYHGVFRQLLCRPGPAPWQTLVWRTRDGFIKLQDLHRHKRSLWL